MEAAQAVGVDEFVLNPFDGGQQSQASTDDSLFAAPGSQSRVGTDEDYVFDASAPATEPVNVFAAPEVGEVDDATKPIPLPVFETEDSLAEAATTEIEVVSEVDADFSNEAGADEAEETGEPKNGELF